MSTQRNISWKGQTFNQIVAGLKMNTNTFSVKSNFFLPSPIKHYRREISTCPARASIVGDSFTQPGGVVTNTKSVSTASKSNFSVDFNLTTNHTERPTGLCDKIACSKSADAKRRVRSSGNVKRVFNASNDTYYTSNNEYLISRNRTVKQNEFNYIRYGDPTYLPGTRESIPNIYSPGGINHCSKVYIGGYSTSARPLFTYQWLDGIVYNFTIADGNYDIDGLLTQFRNTLVANKHYYNDALTGNKVFLFNFVYNTLSDKVQIQCFATNNATIHPTPRYTIPAGATWVSPDYSIVPVIRILNNDFQSVLGINAGNYPAADISGNTVGARNQRQPRTNTNEANNIYATLLNATRASLYGISYPNSIEGNQFNTGSIKPGIGTPYVPLYYKPSNSKFATQGGVDSSSRLARLKYDIITRSANTYMTAYGKQTANALAYGVPGPSYSIKEKIGYTNGRTPVVKANQIVACSNTMIKGG
jgi:hypothetical protein